MPGLLFAYPFCLSVTQNEQSEEQSIQSCLRKDECQVAVAPRSYSPSRATPTNISELAIGF